MTREDIIKLAKECGNWSGQTVEMNDVGLERFARLVAENEREALLAAMRGLYDLNALQRKETK
jgi:Fe2+ transport system protein B